MKSIAVVYHSGFCHTEVITNSVLQGVAEVGDVETKLFDIDEVTKAPELLNDYDAMIMGAPTYMGSISAKFKAFMEASSALWFKHQWKNKIAAGFTNSHSLSGDKLNALTQLVIFAAQHGMIWVGQGEMNFSPDNYPGKPEVVNRIGSWLGVMAQSEDSTPDKTPPEGDKITARLLGKRVAEITLSFDPAKLNSAS